MTMSALKLFAPVLLLTACSAQAKQSAPAAIVKEVMTKELADYPGKEALMLTVVYPPGSVDPVHRHHAHAFVYVLEGGMLKISHPDGSVLNADLKVGQVVWIPAETHWAENTGTTEVKLLVTELKEKAPAKPGAK